MPGRAQSPLERKLHLVASEIGLSRPERMELACYLLRRDIASWSDLDDEQRRRIADAMEGWQLIEALRALRAEQ